MNNFLAFIIINLCCNICFSQEKLRIDPNSSIETNFSDVFESVKFINLETTKESVFGLIKQLHVTDSLYIITEINTNNIFMFYKNGKFKSKILRDEYTNGVIVVDERNEFIYFNKGRTEYKYDFNGALLGEKLSLHIGEKAFLNDGQVIYRDKRVFSGLEDTVSNELYIVKGDEIIHNSFPYHMQNDEFIPEDRTYVQHTYFHNNDYEEVLFTMPNEYKIYRANKDSIESLYEIIFPEQFNLDFKELKNLKKYKAGEKMNYYKNNPDKIELISFPYLIGNNLFFKPISINSNFDSYLYKINSGELFNITKVIPDENSYFLNVINIAAPSEFFNKNFLVSDGKAVYASIPANQIIYEMEINKSKKLAITYPKEIQEIFNNKNIDQNQLIICLIPKN